jgi:hypothetical protein
MTAPPSEMSTVPAPAPLAGPHGVRPGARRRETPEAVRPGDHDRPEPAAPDVCVRVPTRKGRGNVAPLICGELAALPAVRDPEERPVPGNRDT